ncbi:MAG: hypothetical protein ACP5F1_02485 [Thermoplasmata archaeon]|nr:hypothetical protein [Thermoplasmata archaeon]
MGNENLSPLEKLELLLPGFKFYKSMDLIRQDDALVRYALKNNLEKLRELIELKEEEIASKNPMDDRIHAYESLLVLLRSFIQEIFAAQGGMYIIYSRYKIDENDLKNILNHDYSLISNSKDILNNFNRMDIESIIENIRNLRKTFLEREKYFNPENIR